jgi:molybdenum cofactor cytidylyltransferase
MAAGNAARFGKNKLLQEVDGISLIRRALLAVPAEAFLRIVVVTQYQEVADIAKDFNFTVVRNSHPELGASESVALGLSALGECGGALFQVADQPLLRRESVAALLSLWRQEPNSIAALGHGGVRGNPCLFPARFFPELLALTGDRGGSAVIRAHPEALRLLEVPAEELSDVDTPAALAALGRGQPL